MTEPDYIVIRAHPGARIYMPPEVEGRWYDRSEFSFPDPERYKPPTTSHGVAEPTGRFEVRDDGAVAEVWELRVVTP
jgi:hypothetical protein